LKKTAEQYQQAIAHCRSLFLKKAQDYGTSWTILRMPSLTDQIFIKAGRIRSLQEKQVNQVGESQESEFIGIVNYCVIALILLEWHELTEEEQATAFTGDRLAQWYDRKVQDAFAVMQKKNHDYGEAWREMRISSITDLILMKILRLKQIEDNQGKVLVSEGIEANYIDMLNYAAFCLIRFAEERTDDR
jgi:hypothetical protein